MRGEPLIFYASIGHGHKQAAHALQYELFKQGIRAQMIDTFYTLSPTLHHSLLKGYLGLLKFHPSLWRMLYFQAEKYPFYYSIDQLSTIYIDRLNQLIEQVCPPFVISTHALVTPFLTTWKKKKQYHLPIYSVITDFVLHPAYLRDGIDRYFTQDEQIEQFALKHHVPVEKFVTTGIPVFMANVTDLSRNHLRRQLQIPEQQKAVLIAGGGIGLVNYLTIIQKLEDLEEKILIFCMIGENNKVATHLSHLKSKHELRIIPFTKQFLHYLRASDVVISKSGGLTMAEALICETPIIIYQPVPGHEELNAQVLDSRGAAISVHHAEQLLFHTAQVLYDEKLQRAMKLSAKALQKPNAAKHIVENILSCEQVKRHAVW